MVGAIPTVNFLPATFGYFFWMAAQVVAATEAGAPEVGAADADAEAAVAAVALAAPVVAAAEVAEDSAAVLVLDEEPQPATSAVRAAAVTATVRGRGTRIMLHVDSGRRECRLVRFGPITCLIEATSVVYDLNVSDECRDTEFSG